jgi:uncharacterized protein YdeI (YjbR/CyaY-like superfamily)
MRNASTEHDAYIAKAAPFARPILRKVRRLFHRACPDVQETMKWGAPHFEHKGVLGSMAAFKQHACFGFWKASLMKDPLGILDAVGSKTSMGAARITDVSQLPSDPALLPYFREAVALNEAGRKVERPPRGPKKEAAVPDDLAAALRENEKANATFRSFSPSHRREYVEWIVEAKQSATRERRLATAIEWMAKGKLRHWKYMKK